MPPGANGTIKEEAAAQAMTAIGSRTPVSEVQNTNMSRQESR